MDKKAIVTNATELVHAIRQGDRPGLMEVFLAEYGLSTEEGVAMMCLAEALLRVPDAPSIDALIEDKIGSGDWARHKGQSSSSWVNASTFALDLTAGVLNAHGSGVEQTLRGAIKRLGEPAIRKAARLAMREMGRQFVLGESIESATRRARRLEAKGYTYSYDMLGEAARTAADAQAYFNAYQHAILAIAKNAQTRDSRSNPGISVKLSALHPRYEVAQQARVAKELTPRLAALVRLAATHHIGLNIDAEEMDRLALSQQVVEQVLSNPDLASWNGFGMVVQAYGHRATEVVDWFYALAETLDRQFTLRLVKGAYWDTEIKHAQVLGLNHFPVFTNKAATDVNYINISQKLLGMTDRIYPQFATHNAHTLSAVIALAKELGISRTQFEFQRLHGMGEKLHEIVMERHHTRCRIYAPVGQHKDLLAYLVRRLLENGANSSFVNQIADKTIPAEEVVTCPFEALCYAPTLPTGHKVFLPTRRNARGFDLADSDDLALIEQARAQQRKHFLAEPIIAQPVSRTSSNWQVVTNPANPAEKVGDVLYATTEEVDQAIGAATPWAAPAAERADVLEHAAELYERDFGEILTIAAREAGKNLPDAVGELREAVDFLYYYAAQARQNDLKPRGRFACISPWNFPLAIFTGQIAGALAAGNAVLAKPAEQSPLMAAKGVALLHEAGVPLTALQLLPGDGTTVGAQLTCDSRIDGVAFTGGTNTARLIQQNLAKHCAPGTPFIAETGGLNAMVIDSTALHEQAVKDVIASAFQSAGQRCSALRCLYIQKEVYADFLTMLYGAMDELSIGNPWPLNTDIGPVIDAPAAASIQAYIDTAKADGRLLKQLDPPTTGHFIGPAVIGVNSIQDLAQEIFGPVLHVASYTADALDTVIKQINERGYGLTFGVHTRINERSTYLSEQIHAGNIYVNRNQIGAIVASQPFGGEGLSGTGPKAGGPHYLARFAAPQPATAPPPHHFDMPGPTGESNTLYLMPRPPLLCLGPDPQALEEQRQQVQALGGQSKTLQGKLNPAELETLNEIGGVIWWGDEATGRELALALARREGPIIPLITGYPDTAHVYFERHVCIDTTASGGNAELLASATP
ncbi:bifunctional proline dehydrogenase/L-glutamate gamma-semialdehyde dehydrogenase PutA [Spiribacter sp. C176]|uniref:Bifunctional protein PutA n=1 Tax=Spiribacter salilacus TaxID=2664894 RepID=A0A6N7QVC9_9GAMM|nr:bifunctional proline dehydrogenase/L-glutamate gamma-semialdehyde dehydrogenase PutA [Spiribacter salilacus]MRH79108.1 bifunctional proline dehydrogenase/L-glutamate gamma-semialdehyde dehydrogenase PutA [Spiribacter salilacus]